MVLFPAPAERVPLKLTHSFAQYRQVCSEDEEVVYRISMTTKDGNAIATGGGVATSYTHAELINVTARCLHVQGEIFDQK